MDQIYEVREGDTLPLIVFNAGYCPVNNNDWSACNRMAEFIAQENNIDPNTPLRVGMKIRLPDLPSTPPTPGESTKVVPEQNKNWVGIGIVLVVIGAIVHHFSNKD